MPINIPRWVHAAAAFCAVALFAMDVTAQSAWPNRPIKLIVPFAAGGGSDVMARAIATKLGERLGQPVIVDNRAGGGGAIALDAVAKAAPDGYTLAFSTTAFSTIASAGRKLPYDPDRDFVPTPEQLAELSRLVAAVGWNDEVRMEFVRSHPGTFAI